MHDYKYLATYGVPYYSQGVIFFNVIFSLAAVVSFCAVLYPFRPFPSRGKAFLAFLGFVFLNGIFALASSDHSQAKDAKQATSQVEPSSSPNLSSAAKSPTQPEPAANWDYRTNTDDLTDVKSNVACTKSTNELSFNFPYNGGSTGELCFRKKAKVLNAWLRVSSGQFDCGIESCSLKAKFDDGSIQSFRGIESATHESNMVFIEPESKMFALTLKATKLKLQAQYYQEGSQTLQFDLSGLDPSKL